MGARGPQPKPTALRLLQGNPSGRPLPKFEPQPKPVIKSDPPEWLPPRAQEYYRRLVPMLSNIGILTEADLPLLERYCDFLNDWQMMREFLMSESGGKGQICYPVYKTPRKFNPETKQYELDHANRQLLHLATFPHVGKKLNISEHLLRIETHFGMTPAARTRIMALETPRPGVGADVDPFAIE